MDIMDKLISPMGEVPRARVSAGAHVVELLRPLLASPERMVDVGAEGEAMGTVTAASLLSSLGEILPVGDDSSLLEVSCPAGDYSASEVARAVEDADANLLGLWTRGGEDGKIIALVCAGRPDAAPVARSLERYGYDVRYMTISEEEKAMEEERLAALRMYLNIGNRHKV